MARACVQVRVPAYDRTLLWLALPQVVLMGACTLSCVSHLIGWMLLTRIHLSSISMVRAHRPSNLSPVLARWLHVCIRQGLRAPSPLSMSRCPYFFLSASA